MPPQLQEVQRWRGGDRGTRPVLWIRQGRPEWVKREGESVSRSVASDSCDPMDCSPPGSTVHGIVQARILEWVAISFSRGSSQARARTRLSRTAGRLTRCHQGSPLGFSVGNHTPENAQHKLGLLTQLPCMLHEHLGAPVQPGARAAGIPDTRSNTPLVTYLPGNPGSSRASLVAQSIKNLSAMWETWVQSLGQEDPPPGEGNGNPLQYSCLENPVAREGRLVTVARVRHDLETKPLPSPVSSSRTRRGLPRLVLMECRGILSPKRGERRARGLGKSVWTGPVGLGSPGSALGSGLVWAPSGEAWAWVLLPGLCPLLGAGGRPLQRSPFGRGTQGLPFRLTAWLGAKLSLSGPQAQGTGGAGQPCSALGIGHMDQRRPLLNRLRTLLAPPGLGLCKQKPIWGCVPRLSEPLGHPFPLSGHRSSDLDPEPWSGRTQLHSWT